MAYRPENGDSLLAGAFALHCRGDVRLFCDGVDCTPKSKKGRALLAILAAEQRSLTRVKIIDLLWSDRQEEQARASLRTLLADLKEQFNFRIDDLLIVERERVALVASVRTDLTDPALARPVGELFEGLDHIDPELDEWLRVERAKWEKPPEGAPAAGDVAPRFRQPLKQFAPVVVLLLALIAGTLFYVRLEATPEEPVLAVLKFKDLTGKNALLADGLAEELRIHLANHPRVKVIGRESSESQSLQGLNAVEAAGEKLRATQVIEGAVLNRDGTPYLSIRLNDVASGKLIWSQVLPADGAMIRNGSMAIAAQLAGNINETVGQGSGEAFEADARAYEIVFAARHSLRDTDSGEALQRREELAEVVRRYPRFAPALTVLAEATMYSSDHPFIRGPIALARARREAEYFARRAIKVAPKFGAAYTALALARFETEGAIQPLQRAVQLSPGSYEAQHRLARALELSGDYQGSLRHQRTAAALEPLDKSANYMLLRMLRLTGHSNEIPALIRAFIRRTDDKVQQLAFLAGATSEIGDLSKSTIATRDWLRMQPQNPQAHRVLMWNEIFFGDRQAAIAETSSPESITAILLRDDLGALLKKLASTDDDFWSLDWETVDASEYLYSHGRSDLLLRLYDKARAKSGGEQPNPYVIGPALILALREAGRRSDADLLLRTSMQITARRGRGMRPGAIALPRSELLFLSGHDEDALSQLELAQRDDWWNLQSSVIPIEDRAVYRRVRSHPRFRDIVRRHYANIAREKRELHSELRRYGPGPIDPDLLITSI